MNDESDRSGKLMKSTSHWENGFGKPILQGAADVISAVKSDSNSFAQPEPHTRTGIECENSLALERGEPRIVDRQGFGNRVLS